MASFTTNSLRSLSRLCHCKKLLTRNSLPGHCRAATIVSPTATQTRHVHLQTPHFCSASEAAEISKKGPVIRQDASQYKVGYSYTETRTVTKEDIAQFAQVTRDFNPLHLDEEFAKQSQFGQIVGHGAFATSIVIGSMGNKLDGGILYKYEANLRAPFFAGDTLRFDVRIEKVEGRRHTLSMKCYAENRDDMLVVDGTAYCMTPKI